MDRTDYGRKRAERVQENLHRLGRVLRRATDALQQVDTDATTVWGSGHTVIVYVDFVELINYLKLDSSKLVSPAHGRHIDDNWLLTAYYYVLVSVFCDSDMLISIMPSHYSEYRGFVFRSLSSLGVHPGDANTVARPAGGITGRFVERLRGSLIPALLELVASVREGQVTLERRASVRVLVQQCLQLLGDIRMHYGERAQLVWCLRRFDGLRRLGRLRTLQETAGRVRFEFEEDDTYHTVHQEFMRERPSHPRVNTADARALCCLSQVSPILRSQNKTPLLFSSARIFARIMSTLAAAVNNALGDPRVRDGFYWGIVYACRSLDSEQASLTARAKKLKSTLDPVLTDMDRLIQRLSTLLRSNRFRDDDPVTSLWLKEAGEQLSKGSDVLRDLLEGFMRSALDVARVRDGMLAISDNRESQAELDATLERLQNVLMRVEASESPIDLEAIAARLQECIAQLEELFARADEALVQAGVGYTMWDSFGWVPSDHSLSRLARELIEKLERMGAPGAAEVRSETGKLENDVERVLVLVFCSIAEGRYSDAREELKAITGSDAERPEVLLAAVVCDEWSCRFRQARFALGRLAAKTSDKVIVDLHMRHIALAQWQISQSEKHRGLAIKTASVPGKLSRPMSARDALLVLLYWKARTLGSSISAKDLRMARDVLMTLVNFGGDDRLGVVIRRRAVEVLSELANVEQRQRPRDSAN